jgi:chromatin remodeling complex protein RSC6
MDSIKSVTKTNKMPAKKETKTAPVSVAVETPVAAKAAPKARKPAAAKAEVVVPVVDAAAPVAVAGEVVAERSSATILAALQDSLKALGADTTTRVRALVAEAVEATKALKRDARNSKKRHRKDPATMTPEERAVWEARRANNAFLKLRPISDELASFMGLSPKSQRSQTDVTKFIATYVKAHSCFDPTFKRRILPDAKLGKILRVKDGQEVTYLNLQSFLKVHFLKPVVPA